MAKILLVEDDAFLAVSVKDWLTAANHSVDVVSDGPGGLDWIISGQYELVILDWELPLLSGVEILNLIRARGLDVPVIMMTGRGSAEDKVEGLDSGADDYIAKPFELKELGARIRSVLRREHGSKRSSKLSFGDLLIDEPSSAVTCKGIPLKLSRTEFALLEKLVRFPDRVFSCDVLLDKVWSTDSDTSADTVRSHLTRLRQKLDSNNSVCTISNSYGLGYKIVLRPTSTSRKS
ncbi:MAG: response regulator transcription factor [Candidatus Obscuribacterales bacterium]|nr:response regulator transcription factor [Candidatus Obscuribacterales bacterium]